MGQKVRPTGFRTGIRGLLDWQSQWYANKQDFSELLVEDTRIRAYIKKRYGRSGISKIKIERTREKVVVYIYSARVGMIIGKKGQEVDKLTKDLENLTHRHIEVKTMEINRPETAVQGSVPLSTLRARIEYGFTEANTAQGNIGIKVWVNNGDYLDPKESDNAANAQAGKIPKKPARQSKR